MLLDHMHVFCRSLEPSVAFLTEGFGGKVTERRLMGGKPGAVIAFGGLNIFLKESGTDFTPPDVTAKVCGYSHLGFIVDDLDKTLAALCARPDTHAVGEPFMAGKRRCAFVAGPDELYVEVMQQME